MTDYDLRDSGFINYDAAANIERELREQYAVQEAEGNPYKRPRDLDTIFRGQAAKLAAQGVESIYDLMPTTYERDGRTITNLLNKRTGDVLREARVTEGWQTDPTAVTFKKTRNAEGQVVNQPIELKDRNGYFQWGADTSVSDMARYGINFVDGTPVFSPVYKDTTNFTTSDAVKIAAAIAGAYYGGQYLLGGETAAAAGAAEAGTAAAGTAGTAGTAGAGAAGTGLTAGAGGTTGLTLGTTSTGIGGGAIGTGLTAPAGFTLAPGVGASLAAGGAGLGLLEGAQFPVEGLQATASTVPSTAAPFATTTAAEGLAIPTTPGLSAMGGAQGLTIPVAGGTISELGLIPTGAVPALGTDGFFGPSLVNDPNVLGNAVFSTDSLLLPAAASSGMSLGNALQAGLLANTIFNPPKLPQQGPLGNRAQSQFSLPAPQQTIVGLLQPAEPYRRSLI